MNSWVRYSVAVYLGLLLAGLAGGPPHATEAEGLDSSLHEPFFVPQRSWQRHERKVEVKVRIDEEAPPSWLE